MTSGTSNMQVDIYKTMTGNMKTI